MKKIYRPTATQATLMRDVIRSLQAREMCVISGREDGKTRMHYHVVDALGEYDSSRISNHIKLASKHRENPEVIVLPNITFQRTAIVTAPWLMRQILRHCGFMNVSHLPSYELKDRFNEFLLDLYSKNIVLSVAVDNAELLSARAFTVLKELNELMVDKKEVGIASLIAGQVMRMKCDIAFLRHSTEIQLAKIGQNEIRDLLAAHFPSELQHFTDKAVQRISQEQTLLEMIQFSKRLVETKRINKMRAIDEHVIELAKAA